MKTGYTTTIWGERSADCYAGKNCDEKRPLWKMFAAGDMDHDETSENLVFDCTAFPPGTKITVEEPLCPKCGEVFGNCQSPSAYDQCDFDWDEWTDSLYG